MPKTHPYIKSVSFTETRSGLSRADLRQKSEDELNALAARLAWPNDNSGLREWVVDELHKRAERVIAARRVFCGLH